MSESTEEGRPGHVRPEQRTQRGRTSERSERKALNDKLRPQKPSSVQGPWARPSR